MLSLSCLRNVFEHSARGEVMAVNTSQGVFVSLPLRRAPLRQKDRERRQRR